MSILLIQGPHHHAYGSPASPTTLLEGIAGHANDSDITVWSRSCSSIAEICQCLGSGCPQDVELVLLDSGDLDCADIEENSPQLCLAIDQLTLPSIEVHDDCAQSLEPRLRLTHSLVTVILNHTLQASYSLVMAIAAKRLRPQAGPGAQLIRACSW